MLDLSNEVNTMAQVFISKLGLKVYYTNIQFEKIDSFLSEIFKIVLASFWVKDKLCKLEFF